MRSFSVPSAPSRLTLAALFTLALLPAVPGGVHAQSGEEVLRTALERQEARMEGIDNYTIVQDVMGFEATTYFERTEVDGQSVFVARTQMGSEAAQRAPENPYGNFAELASRASLEGNESVDGEDCYVVAVTDLEGTDLFGPTGQGEDAAFEPQRAVFYVDTDDYLIRQMTLHGTSTMQGSSQEASFTAHFQDFREVEGMIHAFETVVTTEGFGAQMSEEDMEQMRRSMEEARAQMENMPEAQRKMMESMMGGQFERMEQMLASGSMDFTVTVKELRVNEGPPGGP